MNPLESLDNDLIAVSSRLSDKGNRLTFSEWLLEWQRFQARIKELPVDLQGSVDLFRLESIKPEE